MTPDRKPKRILVIDDERTFRPDALPPYAIVRYARTAEQAIGDLRWEPWDEVWWDHDLGGGSETKTVISWMIEKHMREGGNGYQALPEVHQHFVHSMNFSPDGRDRIAADLRAMYGDIVKLVLPKDHGLLA